MHRIVIFCGIFFFNPCNSCSSTAKAIMLAVAITITNNSSWHLFNNVLKTFLRDFSQRLTWKHDSRCFIFVGCTFMMWISHPTTSQRRSIRLRSGDCGGYLRIMDSLSCLGSQFKIIWDLWHGTSSCWKYSITRWTWSVTGRLWILKNV